MKNAAIVLGLVVLLLGFTSCGSTLITAESPNAEIYADGVFIGKGNAYIPRTGVPQRTDLEARKNGKVIGQEVIRRKFKFITFIGGMYTYGIGFIVFWKYPREVVIPVPNRLDEPPEPSIWDLPPGGVER